MGCSNEKMSASPEIGNGSSSILKLQDPPVKRKVQKSLDLGVNDFEKIPINSIPDNESVNKPSGKMILNPDEVKLLKDSFKTISQKLDVTGIKMFTKLFIANPSYLAMFPKIVIAEDELFNVIAYERSEALAVHAEIVMNTFEEAIRNVTDYDLCHKVLTSLGAHHYHIAGFKAEYFYSIEQPLLEAVKEVLGSKWNHGLGVIYAKVIRFVVNTLHQAYVTEAISKEIKQDTEEAQEVVEAS